MSQGCGSRGGEPLASTTKGSLLECLGGSVPGIMERAELKSPRALMNLRTCCSLPQKVLE